MSTAVTTPNNSFGAVAVLLHDRGWRPLPVVGKVPVLAGWNELNRVPWDRDDLINAAKTDFAGDEYSCGLAVTTDLTIIDIDILDPELAGDAKACAHQTLGTTPLERVGRAPRVATIYRCAARAAIRSRKLHLIEVMCGTGQVVGFGRHPGTHRPYEWITGASPLTLRSDSPDIPVITERQITQFLTMVGRLVGCTHYPLPGRASRRRSADHAVDLHQRLRIDALKVGFERAAIRLLETAVNDSQRRHLTMWVVVSAAAGRGWDEDRLVQLFEDHFAGWDGVSDDAFGRALRRCFRGG
jgi:hypothetical protein